MSAYLFVHFTSDTEDREHIWFSVSRDGLHYEDLGTEPFLTSRLGTTGTRDPFMIYDEKLKKYFIIATDCKTAPNGDWWAYSHRGSRSILIWESDDLVNWSEERLAQLGVENAGCAWAPEAVFCRERGEWLVFFASCVEEKQRIYAAFTKDFRSFGKTFLYIDNEMDIIDTSIVYDGGYYYRFSKDEVSKTITIQRAKELLSDSFETLYCKALDGYKGLEGPEIFYIDGLEKWCLIVDRYDGNLGYLPLLATDLEKADFRILSDDEYDFGKRKKRHGGVIKISDEEYERLKRAIV
ncbi:MAG: glycoside hydrolase family 43 protein [Eubacterium sp.]|nr:glycoside hydrolase family 43 protein [Eubacterium sp.]